MTLEIDQLLKDRYRIERILGEGGMGTVYMAQDQLLDRPRAIKELCPDPLADINDIESITITSTASLSTSTK